MEVLDLPAENFKKIFGKHSADLEGMFLLDIEEASVQTASDLSLEMLIGDFCAGLPSARMSAAAQRLFTGEDRLRLRKRPDHWKVTMSFLEHFFLPAFALSFMAVTLLSLNGLEMPEGSAATSPGPFDVLAMLGFAGAAWLDHRSTMEGFRRVDTMERNPLFPRYGHNRFVQLYGTLFMIYIAFTFAGPLLVVAAIGKCLAAYANGVYVEKRLDITREEFDALLEPGACPTARPAASPATATQRASTAPAVPAAMTAPAVLAASTAPAVPEASTTRRARPVRFDYGG